MCREPLQLQLFNVNESCACEHHCLVQDDTDLLVFILAFGHGPEFCKVEQGKEGMHIVDVGLKKTVPEWLCWYGKGLLPFQ